MDGSRHSRIERYLWIYSASIVLMTALCWGIYSLSGEAAFKRPLFGVKDQFKDLLNYQDKIAHLSNGGAAALGAGKPIFNYPAPAAYVYKFFLGGFPHHPVAAFITILILGVAAGVFLLMRKAWEHRAVTPGFTAAAAVTAFFGFPLIFTIDRANLEGILAIVVGAGLVCFLSRRYYAAAILIGLAVSIKPFPGIFFLLFLRDRLYRPALAGVVTALGATLLALTALGPNPLQAYRDLQPGVQTYFTKSVVEGAPPDEGRFRHSTLDGMKSVVGASFYWINKWTGRDQEALWAMPHGPDEDVASKPLPVNMKNPPLRLVRGYYWLFDLSLLIDGALLIYIAFRMFSLPVINQILMLSIATTLFSPASSDYTLTEIYVALGLFLLYLTIDARSRYSKASPRALGAMLFCFAALCSPLSLFGQYAGDVRLLFLLGLLALSSRVPLRSVLFDARPESGEFTSMLPMETAGSARLAS